MAAALRDHGAAMSDQLRGETMGSPQNRALAGILWAMLAGGAACKSASATGPPAAEAQKPLDCVGVLHVRRARGYEVANVQRFGESAPALRTGSRLADLPLGVLRSFCDWEACIRTNGYGHTCWLGDAGWELCRVCDGSADCDERPYSQDDCVTRASTANRSQCHVGLLEECLIQQALRGPADPRVTQACQLSAEACAGQLPGDLTAQAIAAQHETDQVTVQRCSEELDQAARLQPDSSLVAEWRQTLATWDGGLPQGDLDATAPSDSGEAGDF